MKRQKISFALAVLLAAGSILGRAQLVGMAYTDEETYCGYTEHEHTDECYEKKLVCKLKESEDGQGHTHTEDCYEPEEVLICTKEESEGHAHTDACYETVPPTLICGKEESAGHTHTEECYTVTPPTLICGLEEGKDHAHTSACYSEEVRELTCGKEESAGHTHTDACYSGETLRLVCGMEESEGHTHTEECYEKTYTLICELDETDGEEGHKHTDDCYELTDKLICGKEEHTHEEICLSNRNADLETAAIWEATLPERTGIWADDVIAIAKSQLGYTESSKNFIMSEDGKSRKGYTRYGAWFGNAYGDWCAMFASFCLYYAGVPTDQFPEMAGVVAWIETLNGMGRYAASGGYAPKPADLVFFDENGNGGADHVGIVEKTEDGILYTIEGNSGNAVAERSYSLADGKILGYGILPQQEEKAKEPGGLPEYDDLARVLFGTSEYRYDLHAHRSVKWLK